MSQYRFVWDPVHKELVQQQDLVSAAQIGGIQQPWAGAPGMGQPQPNAFTQQRHTLQQTLATSAFLASISILLDLWMAYLFERRLQIHRDEWEAQGIDADAKVDKEWKWFCRLFAPVMIFLLFGGVLLALYIFGTIISTGPTFTS